MTMEMQAAQPAFGDRFARRSALGMAGLGVFVCVAVVGQGSAVAFAAGVVVLVLSHFFRRRALYDEQRGRRALEDERDRALLAYGDAAFRYSVSAWMVGLAIALALPSSREVLLGLPLRLPGLLLLGVITAHVVGHSVVVLQYRRDHR